MFVYKITNRVNGKVYIGKWMRAKVEDRWNVHVRMAKKGSNLYFSRAIRKYGADAFTVEVIYQAKTLKELSVMETFFIVLHQSHVPENGYNMTMGGEGGGGKRTPEQRRRISESKRGANHPNWSKHLSKKTRQLIRESKLGSKNPNFKKTLVFSAESLRKRGEAKRKSALLKHPLTEKTCPNCLMQFTVPYAERKKNRVCCSKTCATTLRYKNSDARKAQSALWTLELRAANAAYAVNQKRSGGKFCS